MRYQSIDELKKHLKRPLHKDVAPCYLLVLSDPVETQKCIGEICHTYLQGRGDDPFALRSFDGAEVNAQELDQELNSPSLFGDTSVLLVKRIEKISPAVQKIILQYLEHPSSHICLVLAAEEEFTNSKFEQSIEKKGYIVASPPEKPWEKEANLIQWVVIYARNQGKQISAELAQLLIKRVGAEKAFLATELDKLILYAVEDPAITGQAIMQLTSPSSQETIWQLRDFILEFRGGEALDVLRSLLEEGDNAIGILQMIRMNMQTGLRLCEMIATRTTSQELAKAFPQLKGKMLEKMVKTAQNYGISRFRKALIILYSLDLDLRNSGSDPAILMEKALLKLL
ncbi:MAG: hypothetical protein K0S74_501 [Chlamydiales bacterium]|jgi:DNA polymerase-3 subunit delta|nr:hypothetical protein [Chlamydiales bacterium]